MLKACQWRTLLAPACRPRESAIPQQAPQTRCAVESRGIAHQERLGGEKLVLHDHAVIDHSTLSIHRQDQSCVGLMELPGVAPALLCQLSIPAARSQGI